MRYAFIARQQRVVGQLQPMEGEGGDHGQAHHLDRSCSSTTPPSCRWRVRLRRTIALTALTSLLLACAPAASARGARRTARPPPRGRHQRARQTR